jgi:hypothetical protein
MARQTKAPRFTIYEDVANATKNTADPTKPTHAPASRTQPLHPDREEPDELSRVVTLKQNAAQTSEDDDQYCEDDLSEKGDALDLYERIDSPLSGTPDDEFADLRQARRASILTSTSISSFPESSYDIDHELRTTPSNHPYSPPSVRAAFRRPSSVRRMQMTSPTPFERSPRRSVLHQIRSRPGTPRSAPPSSVKGKSRRLPVEDDARDYPLILLHVTLLPANLRWTPEVMRKLLPQSILDNLELLRCKISETIAQRGILIQHPKEEFELLEERLLQSLELSKERVTKCGHFRARDSVGSAVSSASSVKDSDSAIGSDMETCSTCHQHVKPAQSGVAGEKVWSVKIFAANGLLGPSAWAAAWSDMERVDVEIFPWLDSNLRKQLDAAQAEADAAQDLLDEQEELRIRAILEEQARLACEERERAMTSESAFDSPAAEPVDFSAPSPTDLDTRSAPRRKPRISGFPDIYRRPGDIPLSVLLRNYIFLLAQEPRNVIIFVLAVIVVYLGIFGSGSAATRPSVIATGALEVPNIFDADIAGNAASVASTATSQLKEATTTMLPSVFNATMDAPSDHAMKADSMQIPRPSLEDDTSLSSADEEAVAPDGEPS